MPKPAKNLTIALLILVLLVSLSACGTDVTEGVVVEKSFQPADIQYLPLYNGNTFTLTPFYYPCQWKLLVRSNQDEALTQWWHVSENVYLQTNVGQHVRKE